MPKHSMENYISFVKSLSSIELDSFYTRPSDACINLTISVLNELDKLNLKNIKVSPSPDGEIVIEFFKDLKYHNFDVYDDIIYYWHLSEIRDIGVDEIINLFK